MERPSSSTSGGHGFASTLFVEELRLDGCVIEPFIIAFHADEDVHVLQLGLSSGREPRFRLDQFASIRFSIRTILHILVRTRSFHFLVRLLLLPPDLSDLLRRCV